MHSGIMLIPLRRYSAGEIVRVCFGLRPAASKQDPNSITSRIS